jgi:hypothetical protein
MSMKPRVSPVGRGDRLPLPYRAAHHAPFSQPHHAPRNKCAQSRMDAGHTRD